MHALPKSVHWGLPAREVLPKALQRMGSQRAFLMVSSSLRRDTGLVDELAAALGDRCAGIWDGMPPHTPREAVIEAANAARAARADVIVTLGGGSLTDGAKVVRIALAEDVTTIEGLEPLRYHAGEERRGSSPLRGTPLMPQVTIPTTFSAGDFSYFAGCTDTAKQRQAGATPKEAYMYPAALPAAIILDPAAALRTPLWLLLSTGLRCVDHAVEALCSLRGNPYSDTLLRGALRLMVGGLRRLKADPADAAAALDCQVGMWQITQGSQSGPQMGASHAIGHVLGGAYNVPHGYTSCVALPAVLRWNEGHPAAAARQRLVSEVFEELPPAERAGGGEVEKEAGGRACAAEHVRGLVEELGLPATLRDVGIGREQLDDCARRTMGDKLVATNPRPISDWSDVRQILELAWQ